MWKLKSASFVFAAILLSGCGGSGSSKNSVRIDSLTVAKNTVYEVSSSVKNMSMLETKSIGVLNMIISDQSSSAAPLLKTVKLKPENLEFPEKVSVKNIVYNASESNELNISKDISCPGGGYIEVNGTVASTDKEYYDLAVDLHSCSLDVSGEAMEGRLLYNGERNEKNFLMQTEFSSFMITEDLNNTKNVLGKILFDFDYVKMRYSRTLSLTIEDKAEQVKYNSLVIEDEATGSFINGAFEVLKSLPCIEGYYRVRTLEALTADNAVIAVNNALFDYESSGAWVAYDDKKVFIEFPKTIACNQ